ncbi:hypothetical protein QYF36_026403 [Acer negundo]|nr:hypothetical protein QYF36_026403 [Acer negundo]
MRQLFSTYHEIQMARSAARTEGTCQSSYIIDHFWKWVAWENEITQWRFYSTGNCRKILMKKKQLAKENFSKYEEEIFQPIEQIEWNQELFQPEIPKPVEDEDKWSYTLIDG